VTYPKASENEWIQPSRKGYKMACCDCGLVHELDFRLYKGRIQLRGRRNNRATAQIRRRKHMILMLGEGR
jgi:hypothetical protein